MGQTVDTSRLPGWVWIIGIIAAAAAFTSGGIAAVDYLATAWMSSQNAQAWAPFLAQIETEYGIPPGLLSRIAYQESRFRTDIITGAQASSAGALGMMQLMPQFWDTVRRPVPFTTQDTQDQITQAAGFLSGLYSHFDNWTAAVAAYNAGQSTIDGVLAGTRNLPDQTAQYITQVSADLPDIVSPILSV
jgi:soluble lytic murein transglycosylase-like protein